MERLLSWCCSSKVYSSNDTVVGNVFTGCGLFVWSSYSHTVSGNIVNGKPLVYLANAHDLTVTDAGQVILVRCERIRVENLNLSNTSVGVELWEPSSNTIVNNTISNNNYHGIVLTGHVYSYDSVNSWDDGYPSGATTGATMLAAIIILTASETHLTL